jgi:hypothetical protein
MPIFVTIQQNNIADSGKYLKKKGHGIVPFIITDDLRLFYYRGLREWNHIKGYLLDTCLTAQDYYKDMMEYFKIKY